jgi:DeoR/GlpR family transcriptional regulator of sugar metabolism
LIEAIVHSSPRIAIAFPDERQRRIVMRLTQQGRVVATELAHEFGTSEHTIRRDLRDLAAAGFCQRVYGGALALSPASHPAAARRGESVARVARKNLLGHAAAGLVQAGQTLLLDAGTTNLAIARALPAELALTVVTNAPAIADALMGQPGKTIILIGGRLNEISGGTSGATALAQVQQIRADFCFLGACALDAGEGAAAFDAEDAAFKRALVAASTQVAVAVTNEKLATAAPYRVASLAQIDHLIVEADAAPQHLAALRQCGVALRVAAS